MCYASFFPKNIAQLFIKFTHRFVAIELLTFCKNAKTILLLKRALGISYVNRIDFFCFLTFIKKIGFCKWMNIKMTVIIKRQRARFYIQKKQKTFETFKKKLDNSRCAFVYKKQYTLRYRIFSWIFWSWHLYTKSIILWVTWRFYIQKPRHFAKSKIISDTYLYTKIRHFAFRDFSLDFWSWHLYTIAAWR